MHIRIKKYYSDIGETIVTKKESKVTEIATIVTKKGIYSSRNSNYSDKNIYSIRNINYSDNFFYIVMKIATIVTKDIYSDRNINDSDENKI